MNIDEPHLSRQSLRFRRCHSAKGKPVPKTTMLARTKPNLKLGLAGISRDVIRFLQVWTCERKLFILEGLYPIDGKTNRMAAELRCAQHLPTRCLWKPSNVKQPFSAAVRDVELFHVRMVKLIARSALMSCQVAFLWANHSSVLHNLKQSTKKWTTTSQYQQHYHHTSQVHLLPTSERGVEASQ